jgi:hypothetical protein
VLSKFGKPATLIDAQSLALTSIVPQKGVELEMRSFATALALAGLMVCRLTPSHADFLTEMNPSFADLIEMTAEYGVYDTVCMPPVNLKQRRFIFAILNSMSEQNRERVRSTIGKSLKEKESWTREQKKAWCDKSASDYPPK